VKIDPVGDNEIETTDAPDRQLTAGSLAPQPFANMKIRIDKPGKNRNILIRSILPYSFLFPIVRMSGSGDPV
jgi:hypothetical protein